MDGVSVAICKINAIVTFLRFTFLFFVQVHKVKSVQQFTEARSARGE